MFSMIGRYGVLTVISGTSFSRLLSYAFLIFAIGAFIYMWRKNKSKNALLRLEEKFKMGQISKKEYIKEKDILLKKINKGK